MAVTLEPLAPFDGEDVVTLAQAKAWLKVDDEDDDDLICALRDAAIDWVERYTAKGLSERRWRWTSSLIEPALRPGISPVVTIEDVRFTDAGGAEVELTSHEWLLTRDLITPARGAIWPAGSGAARSVSVTMFAGFARANIPPALLQAVRFLMGHLYRNREAVVMGVAAGEVPMTVMAMCGPYRTPVIA